MNKRDILKIPRVLAKGRILMNLRDISDKLKDTIIPREVKKEDFELTESEKKEKARDEGF
jgi:hypothetical protein